MLENMCPRAGRTRERCGPQRLCLWTGFPQVNAAGINPKLAVCSERLPPKLQADGILLSAAARLRWVLMRLENI